MARIELEDPGVGAGTAVAVVNATVRLRQNSTVIEKNFTIHQDCPKEPEWEEWGILIAVALILLFACSLVWWRKG